MPSTTIHIPPELLAAVDAKAKASGLSRNRLITKALEKLVHEEEGWDANFLRRLGEPLSQDAVEDLDEMMQVVQKTRSSKPPIGYD